jgi:hypothetical protein
MDRCEVDVIIACGPYLLAEEEKRKKKQTKTLDSKSVSSKRRGRRISHPVWTSEK